MTSPAAGWYPDPSQPSRLRYWDGSTWTDFTKPAPASSTAAVQASTPGQPSSSDSSAAPADPYAAQRAGQSQPADPYAAQRPQSDPYAGRGQSQPADPYAAQRSQGGHGYGQQPQPGGQGYGQQPQQGHPQYGQYAPGTQGSGQPPQYGQYAPGQQHPGQQPAYLQQQPNRSGLEQRVHDFNDSIAQGYGDQNFGGHMQGQAGARMAEAGRNVLTERTLIVSQKRKIIEVTNEYTVYAQDGSTLGAVVEVGQSGLKKAVRLMSNYDQFLTHKLEVRDNGGRVLLQLTRPAKVFKSTVIVSDPGGREIGRLVQRNVFGKIRFGLEVGGQEIGSLNAENWRAWNFALLDAQNREVARVTKTWEGLLTTLFTTADNYAVQIHFDLPDPLRSLCVAAALTIDTALKQDDR
ncbi:DUF2510 domain-containing protein [Calidifontibacter sp. DB0510]|uniref:DUF2510 domain-containing protein n=1 Tax=Metallococcus carri TaxID=1656884 RepID=A0A967B0P0_9MICO|nr:phospholipid scramblase-related protein [Metallococcus carri]NHN56138.1 DUF2510 domain-containing protein [Metallococcus carri]NOP37405.1 DUF2510 domain-containing protein [Calidifontibacter sp. DB2511S]